MAEKPKYKKLYLRCNFTDQEMQDLAMAMANKTQQLKKIDQNAKAAATQFKSEKESAQSEIDNAAGKYRDGYEMRNVECEETVDFVSGVVRYWRCDNGELAQERRLTNEDRQMRLDEIMGDTAKEEKEPETSEVGFDDEAAKHDAHVSRVNREMAAETSAL